MEVGYGKFNLNDLELSFGRIKPEIDGTEYSSIKIDERHREEIERAFYSVVTSEQSPTAKYNEETANLTKSQADISPEHAVSAQCLKFEIDSSWGVNTRKWCAHETHTLHIQPWRFEELSAVFLSWKYVDEIGFYGNENRLGIWFNSSPTYLPRTLYKSDKLEKLLEDEIKKISIASPKLNGRARI